MLPGKELLLTCGPVGTPVSWWSFFYVISKVTNTNLSQSLQAWLWRGRRLASRPSLTTTTSVSNDAEDSRSRISAKLAQEHRRNRPGLFLRFLPEEAPCCRLSRPSSGGLTWPWSQPARFVFKSQPGLKIFSGSEAKLLYQKIVYGRESCTSGKRRGTFGVWFVRTLKDVMHAPSWEGRI